MRHIAEWRLPEGNRASVASHRRPKPASRARVTVLTAAAATAVALSAQAAAQAAPTLTLSQAKSEVAADRQAADVATQQYDNAQSQQQSIQTKVTLLQNEIAGQQASINKELSQLGGEAAVQYRDGAVDPAVQLMLSSDPSAYLNQASAQGEVDSTQAALLSSVTAQEAILAREKAEATAELQQQQALLATMTSTKATAMGKLKSAQAVLDALTPGEQTQVGQGGGYGTIATNGSSMSPSQVNLSGISSAAATAMQAALSKVGIAPYAWGGAGPNEFDCSGLVMWAYAQAGIQLPHSSYADESVGSAVSLSDIEVGDIVVLEGGAHVAMYAGNGMVVNAPEYGYTVSIMPISDFGGIVAIRRV